MANTERGVYQPQEDFAAYEDYPEEEGRSRLPLMIVIALVVVAAFGGVVWLAYNQGVAHGRAGAPPIVAAPAGPARTAPSETQTASGTASTPYTGLKVYGEPVPPDEEAADLQMSPQSTPEISVAQPPPINTTPAPPPTVVAQTASSETARLAPETAAPAPLHVQTAPPPPVHTQPAPAPAPSSAMPEVVTSPQASPESDVTVAVQQPRQPVTEVTPSHAHTQIAAPEQLLPPVHSRPAPAPPPQSAPPVQVATAAPAPATTSGGTALAGGAVLQIGSYPSEALASAAWTRFQKAHAGAVTGLSSDVQTAQIPGKGTWYRLRVGPFSTRAEAATKCAALKAQGASCLVAAP